jgi:hypothetical protein
MEEILFIFKLASKKIKYSSEVKVIINLLHFFPKILFFLFFIDLF